MQSLILSHKWINKLIPKHFDAVNLYFVILVRTAFKGDDALLAHERYHTTQVDHHGPMYIWKYYRDADFRLKMEAQAYAVQVIAGADIDACAGSLYRNYDLNIRLSEAKAQIYMYVINMKLPGVYGLINVAG